MIQSKFEQLQEWLDLIVSDIKKDLKLELIKTDPQLYKRMFDKCFVAKLSTKELSERLKKELDGGNENLEDWLIERWVYRNASVYQFFATHLSAIHPDFEQIKSIDDDTARAMIKEGIALYGAPKIYVFSVLNGVVFSEIVMNELAARARS